MIRRAKKTATHLHIHAARRAEARYQCALTDEELFRMVAAIRKARTLGLHIDGKPYLFSETPRIEVTCLMTESDNRSHWKVQWDDRTFFPVFDRARKAIATFLTQEMIDHNLAETPRLNITLSDRKVEDEETKQRRKAEDQAFFEQMAFGERCESIEA